MVQTTNQLLVCDFRPGRQVPMPSLSRSIRGAFGAFGYFGAAPSSDVAWIFFRPIELYLACRSITVQPNPPNQTA